MTTQEYAFFPSYNVDFILDASPILREEAEMTEELYVLKKFFVMEKKVHIVRVKCRYCGTEFDHIFKAGDLLRPHFFDELRFTCIKCGKTGFDHVRNVGKMTLDEWQLQHPGLNIEDLPDYSYMEENGIN
ncbi:MAG: hypothetical protein AAE986_06215 [Thermoplasmataceae archaeon]|jgi:predicted nucleic-acid-binding Zn-ribbon protein|nr:hypothetical protein [Candidatus Thermoplasmatota archaeon]